MLQLADPSKLSAAVLQRIRDSDELTGAIRCRLIVEQCEKSPELAGRELKQMARSSLPHVGRTYPSP